MFRWPSLPDPKVETVVVGDRESVVQQRRLLVMQGVKFYEGRPDKHGHTLRYASNGQCVVCTRAAMKMQRKKATD